ncbi:hypothetical protein BU25DRAFT_373726 [Macroventuria anomochaeta]|uniref:Uncharacterized protein n=1 Tax=Macroventuria anomochaeta TaxID=301207 RepID=A0ACB6RS07_9PLEO|nr:uncharacterized protein BU25DRAFT_373726 [Macroventuria anomochaeta]KAF2624831.1 hypothetical protein BU25DRAFT_373726 [Macroventuria anomochaeta]
MADIDSTARGRTDSVLSTKRGVTDLGPEDVIIAVMGITGCGKTSFVNLFTDPDQKLVVGHGLESCTQVVDVVPCNLGQGETIYLADTPGFDDMYRTDTDILWEISDWLSKAHESGLKLAGIIYLHRIPDIRVGGSGLRNLKMFRRLCGKENLANVVLATNMWDQVDPETGNKREAALKDDPVLWKEMIDHGSQVFRQDNGRTSGLGILTYLIRQRSPMVLDIQRELVDQKMQLKDTRAGKELLTEVEQEQQECLEKVRDLEARMQQLQEAYNRGNHSRIQTMQDLEVCTEKKERAERKLAQTKQDAIKLQATHDQRMAEQKRCYERQLREQEGRQSLSLDQVREEEGKKFRENYQREMRRLCIMM